jgi:hypothetical protein
MTFFSWLNRWQPIPAGTRYLVLALYNAGVVVVNSQVVALAPSRGPKFSWLLWLSCVLCCWRAVNRAITITFTITALFTLRANQGCQIFLDAKYQNWEKYTELLLNYQMAIKCTKWPYYIQNGQEYTNHFPLEGLEKLPKFGFLVRKETIWQPWLVIVLLVWTRILCWVQSLLFKSVWTGEKNKNMLLAIRVFTVLRIPKANISIGLASLSMKKEMSRLPVTSLEVLRQSQKYWYRCFSRLGTPDQYL